jgi:hypothetical protein
MSLTDFSSANEQRPEGCIPDGTFVALKLHWRPGGENVAGCSPDDLGLFKQSLNSDVVYIDTELSVTGGPYNGRKLWQNFTVAGGKVTEAGVSKAWNISKDTLRAMIDSALGLDPKDVSAATKAKRNLPSFRSLEGIEFFAKLGIEKGGAMPGGGNYPDKNRIAHVVVPGEPQYAELKAGKEVTPAPSQIKEPEASTPPWQQGEATSAPAQGGPAWLKGDKK